MSRQAYTHRTFLNPVASEGTKHIEITVEETDNESTWLVTAFEIEADGESSESLYSTDSTWLVTAFEIEADGESSESLYSTDSPDLITALATLGRYILEDRKETDMENQAPEGWAFASEPKYNFYERIYPSGTKVYIGQTDRPGTSNRVVRVYPPGARGIENSIPFWGPWTDEVAVGIADAWHAGYMTRRG